MRKTSIYLPDGLKRRLEALAGQTHRSEAELVRDAIQRLVADEATLAISDAPPVPGRLVGIGVGPGAADLVTVRAVKALRRATAVVAPCTSIDAIGRAETIVREAAPDIVVDRLVFAMAPNPTDRADALDAAARHVIGLLVAGEEVAFVTIGDPNVYSTFSSIATEVAAALPATPIITIPGVMAFQELAARSATVIADGQQSFVVLPANATHDPLAAALSDPTRTVVVYKGGARMPEVADELRRTGRLPGAMVGELLGMPGERVAAVADVADRPASYLSAVIVPARDGGDA